MKRKIGRPRKCPSECRNVVGISFPAGLVAKIDAAAKAREDSRSGLVAAAITAYLADAQNSTETMPSNAFLS